MSIVSASASNNIDMVKQCLDKGAKADECGSTQVTALMYACANAYEDIIQLLLQHGADPFFQDSTGAFPLYYAMGYHANYSTICSIIELGITHEQINKVTLTGSNALIYGCQRNSSLQSMELLLKHNININHQTKDGSTALMFAVQKNNIDIIYLLLKYNCNIYLKNNMNQMAIELTSNKIIIQLLNQQLFNDYFAKREFDRILEMKGIYLTYSRKIKKSFDICGLCLQHPVNCKLCCNHIFCIECIATYYYHSNNSNCPICRNPVGSNITMICDRTSFI